MDNETYYSKHRKKLLQRAKEYYLDNKVKVSNYNRIYWIENSEKIRERQNQRNKILALQEIQEKKEREEIKKLRLERREKMEKLKLERREKMQKKKEQKKQIDDRRNKLLNLPIENNEIKIVFD